MQEFFRNAFLRHAEDSKCKKIPLALTLVASTDHINKHLAEVEKDMGRHYFTI